MRLVGGAVLVALGGVGLVTGLFVLAAALAALLVGTCLVLTGVVGWCPLNRLLGLDTSER